MRPDRVWGLARTLRMLVIALFVIARTTGSTGQNLVLNGSFEDTACVGNITDIPSPFSGIGWYTPTLGTADLYGTEPPSPGCFIGYINDPGMALTGWQYPADGQLMAGLITYTEGPCQREFLQGTLTTPLEATKRYCVSFRASLAEYADRAHDRLGAYLSADPLTDYTTYCDLGVAPQIESPMGQILADTSQWMIVSGELIATGGEQYITIGHFIPNDQVNAMVVPGTGELPSAYYFIDEVIVEQCDIDAAINEQQEGLDVWRGSSGGWNVRIPRQGRLSIFDHLGRSIQTINAAPGVLVIDPGDVAPGAYVFVLSAPGLLRRARVIVPGAF